MSETSDYDSEEEEGEEESEEELQSQQSENNQINNSCHPILEVVSPLTEMSGRARSAVGRSQSFEPGGRGEPATAAIA